MPSKDTLVIKTPEDYRFAHMLAYLKRSSQEILHTVTEEDRILKAFDAGGRSLLLEVGAGGGPGQLEAKLLGVSGGSAAERTGEGGGVSDADAEEQAAVCVREWLDTDVDLTPFYELSRTDKVLRDVAERGRGLRIAGIPDLFEALCWAIMGQQINLTFAYKLKRRFVEAFGRSIDHQGHRAWLFPTPHRIASVEPDELTAMQLSASKVRCILTVAQLLAGGELDKSKLAALAPEEAMAALTAIRGIGPWSAHYVSMHCLRHRDAFPAEDAGLHNALKERLGLPGKPSLAAVRELGERWRPWRAYAVFYLWNIR